MTRPAEDRWSEELSAYHDGELGWWARRRLETRLRSDPALRAELEELEAIRASARSIEVGAGELDLWAGLEGRLRSVDAAREAEPQRREARWQPLAAAAAAAALTLAVVLARWTPPVEPAAEPIAVGSVRSLDTGGRAVLVQEQAESTIIWLVDSDVDQV